MDSRHEERGSLKRTSRIFQRMPRLLFAFFGLLLLLIGQRSLDATTTLTALGQTPGGAAYRTLIAHGRLYAGLGTSLWTYDASDPTQDNILASRNFGSLINDIVSREDSVIFVAANHDGLWALDVSHLPDLTTLAHLETPGDTVAIDIAFLPPDTLYLTDGFSVRILHFTGDTFNELNRFAYGNTVGVDIKGGLTAVSRRGALSGSVTLFNSSLYPDSLSSFSDVRLVAVERVRFADLRDDVLYVCGGSLLGLNSYFLALGITNGESLEELASYESHSNYGMGALTFITDLDSRNDTLFLVTTAGVLDGRIELPVLDATLLPDSMPVIAHIVPGLYYFDLSLHPSLPAIAIASEWFGIRWMDLSGLSEGDTLFDDADTIAVHPTGGWGMRPRVKGDTLWLSWEGYGVGIFDISDPSNPLQIGRLDPPVGFAKDISIVNDTLAFVALTTAAPGVFNLRPWLSGGEPEFIKKIRLPGILVQRSHCLAYLETDMGPRIVCGNTKGAWLIDPNKLEAVNRFLPNHRIPELIASRDTLFVPYDQSLQVLRVTGDTTVVIAEAELTGEVSGIGREGELVAVASDENQVLLFQFTGSSLVETDYWSGEEGDSIRDVELKNGLIYVSLGPKGLVVLEASEPGLPVVATFPGSGGVRYRPDLYGTTCLEVGEDGRIYLGDYHAGSWILEGISPSFLCGDANGDGQVNTGDLNFLANYLFFGGPQPDPLYSADVNGDCVLSSADLVYLGNYLFEGGEQPNCCPSQRRP